GPHPFRADRRSDGPLLRRCADALDQDHKKALALDGGGSTVTRDVDPSMEDVSTPADDDAELGQALENYLADLEAGRPADREQLLAEHPAIARQLRACLQVMNLADRMVDSPNSDFQPRRLALRAESTMLRHHSTLATLSGSSGATPCIRLRDLPDEPEPVIKPRSLEMPARNEASLGRYQLQGEIARGGIGAVLKCRDV